MSAAIRLMPMLLMRRTCWQWSNTPPFLSHLRNQGRCILHDGCKYFLVKNFINDSSFFEWDQTTHKSYFKKSRYAEEITVRKLREMAYEG